MFTHSFISLIFAAVVYGQTSNECTAFTSNGIVGAYYQYYRLYDFRHLAVPGTTTSKPSANHPRNRTVTDGTWRNDWFIRNYPRNSPGGTVLPVNFTPKRAVITASTDNSTAYSSYLTLSTARINKKNQEAGEMTFREFNASYASVRVYGRVRGAPGGVAGIFTYQNDTQEIDIEMFTRSPTKYIQYSNQPASSGDPDWIPIPGASINDSLPTNKQYTDWHVHRFDWTPKRTAVFIDNIQTNTTTLNVPVADPPSQLYLNMWSSASDWTGSMTIGNNATFDIQWVELLFNSTDSIAKAATNKQVCIVDTITPSVAPPAVVVASPASAAATTTAAKGEGLRFAALDGGLFGSWLFLVVYNLLF